MTAPGSGSCHGGAAGEAVDDSLFGGEANLTASQAAMVALSTEQKQRKSQLALVTLKVT